MKRTYTSALAAMLVAGSAMADITVITDPSVPTKEFDIEYGYISDMVKPRMERPEANRTKATATDGKFVIKTMPEGNAQYVIPAGDNEYIVLYTHPADNLEVNIKSLSPLVYTVTGSKLMEDISRLDMESSKLLQNFRAQMATGKPNEADIEQINKDYNKIFTDYMAANPDAEAMPYALMHLDGQEFLDAYNNLTPAAKGSSIALFLKPKKQYVERKMEADRRKVQLQSGTVDAPDFTFDNADGKPVSLSQFKGKWVIIDFWGTWCPWCIKGFPALKEAYATYKPKLEVIGVACNDKYENWKKGIVKYELPWVNVYNPEEGGGKILEEYAVEGFPTKVIVNPEGKIVNITSGEDPEFFNVLKDLIK